MVARDSDRVGSAAGRRPPRDPLDPQMAEGWGDGRRGGDPASPDFSKVWVHRDPGSEKIVLRERFVSEAGGARCRQSVAQICLALHRLKGARWWRRSTAAG